MTCEVSLKTAFDKDLIDFSINEYDELNWHVEKVIRSPPWSGGTTKFEKITECGVLLKLVFE